MGGDTYQEPKFIYTAKSPAPSLSQTLTLLLEDSTSMEHPKITSWDTSENF